MATTGNIPTPTKHVYTEINQGKYKTTRHYNIVEVTNGKQILSDLLNVNLDRNCAKSSPTYWLSIRKDNKWIRLTGLFKTPYLSYFVGDKGRNNIKEDMIISVFSEDNSSLTVYYFKGYYSNNLLSVIQSINR
jgi:hypothetical protein